MLDDQQKSDCGGADDFLFGAGRLPLGGRKRSPTGEARSWIFRFVCVHTSRKRR